ncbi:MAG: hypothetical protein JHC26_12835 [Thermofilum sp.]|uniref:hypothetical protein n=1 Tax=Thermofilum sp. TaxID=1961369 RepID=UPI002584233E|nr:hypothetical protein [Thermofilum sp.]MCI4409972.1 hypothetical protein [Thermofilum sp.]
MWEIVQYVKKLGYNFPSKCALATLRYLTSNNKAYIYKFYKDYAIYCIGREYNDENLFDHKEIRKCIEQNLPVFNVANVVECVTGKKAGGNNAIIYLGVLYELMKMIKERRIRYFIVTGDRKNRLKVMVDKEITTKDLQRNI